MLVDSGRCVMEGGDCAVDHTFFYGNGIKGEFHILPDKRTIVQISASGWQHIINGVVDAGAWGCTGDLHANHVVGERVDGDDRGGNGVHFHRGEHNVIIVARRNLIVGDIIVVDITQHETSDIGRGICVNSHIQSLEHIANLHSFIVLSNGHIGGGCCGERTSFCEGNIFQFDQSGFKLIV